MRTYTLALPLLLLGVACKDDAPSDDTSAPAVIDVDGDGFGTTEDCDDENAAINGAATELCDGVDNNCDGVIDDDAQDLSTWYGDGDRDGYGADSLTITACAAPDGFVADGGDCDDADTAYYPGAPETDCADPADYNCDGSSGYADNDNDGFAACEECDDGAAAINPSAAEICDGADNNCDGTIDEATAADAATFYADADRDGYGDKSTTTQSCALPSGYVTDATDCDDADKTVNPAATETCDGADNDCDKTVDEDAIDADVWYADADGDGYGDADTTVEACDLPSGYTDDDSDCDDTNPKISSACFPSFSGVTGSTWQTLTASTEYTYSLQSYHYAGEQYIFNMYDTTGQKYDVSTGKWTTLSATAPYSAPWTSMAPVGSDLYMIRNSNVYKYTPATDTWTTVTAISGGDDYNMTESDEYGVVYGHTSSGQIVAYDTVTGTLTYTTTGYGSEFETRLGYDPGTRAIFFGAYDAKNLYKFDLTTKTVSVMASHPESQLNDIFCSDRSGHIYAAGSTSGTTMYQYAVSTGAWKAIASLPTDHGNNGSCTVSGDGWLYVGTGSNLTFYRLQLY